MDKETESCESCSTAKATGDQPADVEFADKAAGMEEDRDYFGHAGLNAFSGETDAQANLRDVDARVAPDADETDLDANAEFADEEAFGDRSAADAPSWNDAEFADEGTQGDATGKADDAAQAAAMPGVAAADSAGSRYHDTLNSESDAYEEYAAEVAPYPSRSLIQPEDDKPSQADVRKADKPDTGTGGAIGWLALVLAVASLFIWPVVLGPIAAVAGIVAYIRGRKALGVWSIIIGAVAVVAYLAIVPLYR